MFELHSSKKILIKKLSNHKITILIVKKKNIVLYARFLQFVFLQY